jgi:hypothetical protein
VPQQPFDDSSITIILMILNVRTRYLLSATKTVITAFLEYFC